MSTAEDLLARLPRTSLVVGKGGVGKTTCAAGLSALSARRGERTLLVSTDPAAALASVVGAPVDNAAAPLPSEPNLDVRQLSAADLREEFLGRWRDTIADIVDRGTYLDRDDVNGLVDAAIPGADEIFAMLALADLLADRGSPYARIVVDTAPTGHTLRLLALPESFAALISMLDLMQGKHRFVVRALTRRYRRDHADAFIDEMRERIDGLRAALADPARLAAVVVARDEPMVATETERYLERLRDLHIRIAAVVVNGATGGTTSFVNLARETVYWMPLTAPPQGVEEVLAAVQQMHGDPPAMRRRRRQRPHDAPREAAAEASSLLRQLTIVGGKGGVGKSTVACALALAAVDRDGESTLLVSTDPAPSLADALAASDSVWAATDEEGAIEGAPGLVVRQMDAGSAFTRARDQYQSRIDSVFEALMGRGIDVEQDRAILRDLFALAPPGVDELFALAVLGDALSERRFARIIVDPAPTGHLLRLLEMPSLALDWTHRLMRLLLKYREVAGLGDTARELLDFAKRTRALDALLRDSQRSTLVLVALDEPVVQAETGRLVAAARDRGLMVGSIIWNRVSRQPSPLTVGPEVRQLFAEEVSPHPTGLAALRTWARSWHELPPVT